MLTDARTQLAERLERYTGQVGGEFDKPVDWVALAQTDPIGYSAAIALSENWFFKLVMDEIRADCTATWQRAGVPAQREEQWYLLKALETVQARITTAIDGAKMAEAKRVKRQAG